jgi:tetratricopeptide (TPR) repeat protein
MYAIDSWDFEPAVEAFKDYQTFYEHDVLGWIYPNYPLRMLGRTDEAMANMRKAIAIAPNRSLLFVDMAVLAIAREDLPAAREWIARARESGNSEDTDALDGSIAFLQGRFEDATRIFESLGNSQNPRALSRSYERLACLFAERGLYHDAIHAVEAGMREDLAQGNPAAQSSKLTARAQMDGKLGDFPMVITDLEHAVELDRSPESLLSIEAVLGPAIQTAPHAASGQMRSFAVSLQKYLPGKDYGAIYQIVQLRVQGEALLAEGKVRAAGQVFRELDAIDAPVRSREYLGRVLATLAATEANPSIHRELETEAKNAYARVALKPSIVWVDPLAYPPGALADELYRYVSLARSSSDSSIEVANAIKRYSLLRGELHNAVSDQQSAVDAFAHETNGRLQ